MIAPDTSNTKMLYIDQITVLMEMGVRITNELYYGVLITNNREEEEMNPSRKIFLKKLAVRLAGLVLTKNISLVTPSLSSYIDNPTNLFLLFQDPSHKGHQPQ